MKNLNYYRLINVALLVLTLFLLGYFSIKLLTLNMILIITLSFILGIEWFTLLITDKHGKYYMKLGDGGLIEFVKIVIQKEHKETLEIKKPEIHVIEKEPCEHNYIKEQHYRDNYYIYRCSKCDDIIVKKVHIIN